MTFGRAAGAAIDFLDVGLHVHEPGGVLDVDAFSRWRLPEAGNYKLNVGFSTDARNKLVGLGVIIRESNGLVAAAMTQQVPWCDDKTIHQALVVLTAVKFAYDVSSEN